MDPLLDWPELLGVAFLVAGIFLALFSDSVWTLYAVCALMGLLFGRLWYRLKSTNRVQVVIMFTGFLIGFLLLSLYTNVRLFIIIFAVGMLAGYYLHKTGHIRA